MNFRPEKLFLGKNQDGSNLRIEEWNYDTRAGYELIGSFYHIFAMVIFVEIISPLILIKSIDTFNGRATIFNVIGLLLGSYFLYDAYHGWLVTNFLNIFLSEKVINVLIYLNTVSVVLHAVFLLFSTIIYNTINYIFTSEEKCKQAFLSIIVSIGLVVTLLMYTLLTSNPGWINKNIQACLERNKRPEPIEIVKPKPIYNDGFFHDDPNFLSDFDDNPPKK